VAELVVEVEPLPSAEQLEFVETSLRRSFRVTGFGVRERRLAIEHHGEESPDAIRAMVRRFLFIAKSVHKDLVFHNDVAIRYRDDPQPALEQAGEVVPLHPGFYSMQGDFLRVMRAIDAAVRRIASAVKAIEQEHPAVWPVRLFKMIDYFHEFPHQMILCAPVKDDFATRSAFSVKYRKDADFESVPMDEMMAEATYGLQPAVCDCCYYALEGRRTHADTFYTTVNKAFRNERSPTNGLDRLTNFTVRDVMYVGSEEFVLEARQHLIELLIEFLQGLRLHVKIETANDPFFANDAAMKSVFQNAHRLKYEMLARIPHMDKDIAVGSINLHTDFFGKAFDIRMNDGRIAHSGCIGVGYERLAYALYCQNGPTLARWPRETLDFLQLAT
jgi:seryl-tRNA synthetase